MTPSKLEASLSKNHRLVHEIVAEQGLGRHLGMSDVLKLARERRPAIGLTTVYRALIRLRELGLVSEVALPGADCAYFELAGAPHAHFRCMKCGTVSDVAFAIPPDAIRAMAAELGGEITRSTVTLDGRCAACT
ncbi:MAG: transcriptional repressor [Candidatus Baltobacteraceae bacterium]